MSVLLIFFIYCCFLLQLLDDSDDEAEGNSIGDLELYLSTPRSRVVDGEKFDVLKFWEGQMPVYPVLASLARDVLAIPITSVASESSFSMGGRILNKYRGTMLSKHVEVMVTAQNWSRGYFCDIDEDVLVVGKEMEVESASST